jgi:hypothetical protein
MSKLFRIGQPPLRVSSSLQFAMVRCVSSGTFSLLNVRDARWYLDKRKVVRERQSILFPRFPESSNSSFRRDEASRCCELIFGQSYTCSSSREGQSPLRISSSLQDPILSSVSSGTFSLVNDRDARS